MNRNYLKNSLIKSIKDRLEKSQLTHNISKVFSTIYFVDIKNDVDEKTFIFDKSCFVNEIKVIYNIDNTSVTGNFEFLNIDYENKSVCLKLNFPYTMETHTLFSTNYCLVYSIVYEIYNIMTEKNTLNNSNNLEVFDDISKLLDDVEFNIRILLSENDYNKDNINYEHFVDKILDIYDVEYVKILENNEYNLSARRIKTIFENCISTICRDILNYSNSILYVYIPVEMG